jgi:hypothetical protein
MESEANKSLKIPSPDELIISPYLDEDVLRHIATFLDFNSIRQFRLISREWNAAFLPILMKRGTYNLIRSSYGNEERRDLLEGAKHYSSWKISHSVYKSSEILHDTGMWGNVRSLTINTWLPLKREFLCWAWETIQSHCADVQELTVIFEPIFNSKLDSEVVSDYEQAIQRLPNPSFPNISRLNNLVSVHFKGICDEITAYFAQHLLQATTPSLRYLSFCPISEPNDSSREPDLREPFRVFEYLKQSPNLLKNLQSFSFKIGNYSGIVSDDLFRIRDYEKESKFAKFLKRNTSLPLQFSGNLTTLFWDSPFHLHDQLLPGVLTPSVASSLVQLCLNGRVEDLGETANNNYTQSAIKISFPIFPRLRALKLGLFACLSLSVPELVDSAPNLQVLEMKALRNIPNDDALYWRASRPATYSNPKHTQLRIFSTDIPFQGLSTLEMVSSKFPNLVELRLGTVFKVSLDTFLDFVKSHHPNLQRLRWNSSVKFIVAELFHHLIRVPEQLPELTSYSLGNERYVPENFCNTENKDPEMWTNRLLNLFSSSNDPSSCLLINLLPEILSCNCGDYAEHVWEGCMSCSLRYFLKCHNHLPIRIPSEREIREMEKKFSWDRRFSNCTIYK